MSMLIFWVCSIIGWGMTAAVVAVFPALYLPGMIILAVALTSKAASMIFAIGWIWHSGQRFVLNFQEWESERARSESELQMELFTRLDIASSAFPPFGIFDCRWFKQLNEWNSRGGLSRTLAVLLQWVRHVFYRFEALMVLSTLALIFHPDLPSNLPIRCLAAAISVGVAINITAMGLEVLVGNVIMGPGYDRYCHRHLKDNPEIEESEGHALLISVRNFARLAGFSLMAVAAVFQSLHAQAEYKGFAGTNWEEFQHISPYDRLREYGEFAAFTMTTFATVGYGDVHPDKTWTRLCVAYLHLLGMGMILVMLQLLLTKRDWPKSSAANNPSEGKRASVPENPN